MTLLTGLYSHQNKVTGNDPAGTPENRAHAEKAGKTAKELADLLDGWYVPEQRQAGKFKPAAPMTPRKPKRL